MILLHTDQLKLPWPVLSGLEEDDADLPQSQDSPTTVPAGCTAPEALAKVASRDPEKAWPVQTQGAAPSVLGEMLPTQWVLSEMRRLTELIWLKMNRRFPKAGALPSLSPSE